MGRILWSSLLPTSLDVKVGGVDVKPASGGAYLNESDLQKLRGIFWANNITGVSPELAGAECWVRLRRATIVDAPGMGLWFDHALSNGGAPLKTGAVALHPLWKLSGTWPNEDATTGSSAEVVVGSALASRLGLKVGDVIDTAKETASANRFEGIFAAGGGDCVERRCHGWSRC